MKKIRNYCVKYHICTLISVSFLLFSCSKDEIYSDKNSVIKKDDLKTSFSDEEVFKGVMFLEGPVADKMEDFKDLNFRTFVTEKSQIQGIVNFQNEIIAKLKSSDPNYLSTFRKNIGSGDYYVVKSTISKASSKISNTAFELANVSKGEISEVAKKFTASLKSKYHIDENSSKEDMIKAIKGMQSEKQSSRYVVPKYVYKWAAVWLAAAAVLIIVIVLEEAPVDPLPTDPSEPFPDDSTEQIRPEKRYLVEDYQSDITFELKGI
ncbi:hypothetical protein [Flavobacterium sp. HJJ]|uniref:hypothetical protein n=1 Tax=Flavobacterium sp. HJJ TaxID=2783792 RepID=UPI00188B54A1|nr:hypothetical protein [Flavobacterium sp. HJJ]MBF4472905.1 hypothetical protein [Flavobacterium sp. HJJ]